MTIYKLKASRHFDRDVKALKRKHRDMDKLKSVLALLAHGKTELLAQQYRDHKLTGALRDFRELHIEADWLLVHSKDCDTITITLTRTGSHDDLL